MEETATREKPGFFTRLFTRPVDDFSEIEDMPEHRVDHTTPVRGAYRYTISVRRDVRSFDDAMAAANGLKRGEQQILNLSETDPNLRQKIVDFMAGVNFSLEGTWQDVGEHIYLIVPNHAFVDVPGQASKVQPFRN
jgi:cell division inhibitor SepF